MRVTATKLRQNIYAILDEALEKGIPVEVERKGKILKIVPEKTISKLDRIRPWPDLIVGDPEEFKNFKIDWEKDWHEPENLDALEKEAAARKVRKRANPRKRA
jgi:hypothetical protein